LDRSIRRRYVPAVPFHTLERTVAPKPSASWRWELHAACRDDGAIFLPPRDTESPRSRRVREQAAKHICAACPVRVPCRDFALRTEGLIGVWGGLGESERRAVRSRTG
jgi:WhiB family redox-sensing transcriptional regulator